MKVAVVGTGYVGLVTGVVLADMGNDVLCIDNDPEKLEKLRNGVSPIFELGVDELLRSTIADGFFRVSDSIAEGTKHADVVFIAVGTPPGPDGTPDTTAVKAVAKEIGRNIDHYTVVVNKSTVPVGTVDLVTQIILDQGCPAEMFDVVSNPEFLREGTAVWDTKNPDRVVIGTRKPEAAAKLQELYAPLEKPTLVTDPYSAELIKYASNSFLAIKISFINAISRVCEAKGANVQDVAKGVGADSRIGPKFLQAGLGWGGSCLPKDVAGLIKIAEGCDYDFALLKAADDINKDQTQHFLRRMKKRLGGFQGKTVALLGLAFKPNTDDIRDAKSLEMIETLLAAGAKVQAFDPVATDNVRALWPQVEYVEHIYDVSDGADALVLVTEWNEFKSLDLARLGACMKQRVLFDGRRCYKKENAERAGFEYYTIGS
ncbi:MAG: UDP-glucose/GDP-mannose dehydrogenase family protein [Armatimonadetes bacterium]|nr:UDP-glucose/GDP-mannose dehydrogenase family protein [Armatimonadota bacterium]